MLWRMDLSVGRWLGLVLAAMWFIYCEFFRMFVTFGVVDWSALLLLFLTVNEKKIWSVIDLEL